MRLASRAVADRAAAILGVFDHLGIAMTIRAAHMHPLIILAWKCINILAR